MSVEANVKAKDKQGKTALYWEVQFRDEACTAVLRDAGAKDVLSTGESIYPSVFEAKVNQQRRTQIKPVLQVASVMARARSRGAACELLLIGEISGISFTDK